MRVLPLSPITSIALALAMSGFSAAGAISPAAASSAQGGPSRERPSMAMEAVPAGAPTTTALPDIPDMEAALLQAAPGLRPEALRAALASWQTLRAAGEIARPVLTVIDYSLPSTARRLWVFDMDDCRLLFHELVAHGRNSGEDLASAFSNDEGSLMTSLGAFVTGETYVGKNGYSMRLHGMDPGVNDRAEERAIVMHGAPYVTEEFARKVGRLGRSWGCPALRPEIAQAVIDAIKDRSLLYAWYPDPEVAPEAVATASPATSAPAASAPR